jgi:hypothetical protein
VRGWIEQGGSLMADQADGLRLAASQHLAAQQAAWGATCAACWR